MEIRKLKQVEEVANKYFKCVVRPLYDTHAKGAKGVKLIVGMKANPAYDPALDPNSPDLPQELKENKALLASKTNPEAPDVRILWIPPGTTDKELAEKWLIPIQNSLKEKKPIIAKDPTLTKLETESDADLAAQLASGEKVDSRVEEWDDGYEDDTEPTDKPMARLDDSDGITEPKDDTGPDLLEAIGQIADNMQTLSKDVGEINSSLINIETRVNNLEKKPNVKQKPKTKK